MDNGALAGLPAPVCLAWVGMGGLGPISLPDREVWPGVWPEGPLLICPNEALPSLGSFPGLFVRVALANLVREGPQVSSSGKE